MHNRVENIQEVAGMIQRLLPDARIAIGHGQMDGKKIRREQCSPLWKVDMMYWLLPLLLKVV